LRHKQNEIRNLNKTISKKNNENSDLIDTNKQLQSQVDNLSNTNKQLQTEVSYLEQQVSTMQKDYDNYQFIKQFEQIKFKMSKQVYDISDKYEVKSFCRDKSNENILLDLFEKQSDYWVAYNKMRLHRNKLCHVDFNGYS
jgi:predicted nuclease with TOPRIM domain